MDNQTLPFGRWLSPPGTPLNWRDIAKHITTAWVLTTPVAIAISFVLDSFLGISTTSNKIPTVFAMVAVVVISPIAETALMFPVFNFLRRIFTTPTTLVATSAVVWAIAHELAEPAWGLLTLWPFVVFSAMFLLWEPRSRRLAFVMTALLHSLHNLTAVVLSLLLESSSP